MSHFERPWFRVWGHGRGREVRALYREGCSFVEIAAMLGMHKEDVRRLVRFKAEPMARAA